MKTNVKLSWQGHKNDNGPGGYNYKTLHLSEAGWNGVRFHIGGTNINMYGHPLSVVGSSISVHGGASLQITKEPSLPPSCDNPVPCGVIMNMNHRGEWNSSSQGEWDGEGVVEIDDNLLAYLPSCLRIEERVKEEYARKVPGHMYQAYGSGQADDLREGGIFESFGVCFGCPTFSIRYPRRGRYPYLQWKSHYHWQDGEARAKGDAWIRSVVDKEMATFKWPEIPKRAPAVYQEIGEVPGEVADAIDMSDGRELRRAINDGKGGEVINGWLYSLSEQEFERVAALVAPPVPVRA